MKNEISQTFFDEFFRKYRKTVFAYLRNSKEKGDNYDPFRESGDAETSQNPVPIKAIIKTTSPSSLTYRELGLVNAGAIQIIIQNKDVQLIKNSVKLIVDNAEYYVYSEAVGNRFLIFPTQFSDFSKIIVFLKDAKLNG